jgi:hypothetical protein
MTRAECCTVVARRAMGRCERCGHRASRRFPMWHRSRAHVNEKVPRSKGGDPTDPSNCEWLCQACHMPDGQHAPTKERMERLRSTRRTEWPE